MSPLPLGEGRGEGSAVLTVSLCLLLLLAAACGGDADPCSEACEGVDCKPRVSTCVLSLAAQPQEEGCAGVAAGGTCASSLALVRCVAGQRVEEACVAGSACGETQGLAGCRALACTEGALRCGPTGGGLERCRAGAWAAEACSAGCRGDALLGACGDAPARLTGTVRFAKRTVLADFSDWGTAQLVPAAGFLVGSYRGTQLVDLQVTDGSGRFDVAAPGPLPLTDADLVVVYAAGRSVGGAVAYAVADPDLPAGTRAPGPLGDGARVWSWARSAKSLASGAAFTLSEREGSGAARLFESLRSAWSAGRARYGREGLPLVAWLGYGTDFNCGACFAQWPVTVAGRRWEAQAWFSADGDEAYWSDAVSLHELGHWTMASYGTVPDEGGPHTLGVPTFPGQAWSEGWATFFSADVRGSSRYYDKQDGALFWVDLAHPDAFTPPDPEQGLLQRLDEGAVSALLYRAARAAGSSQPLYGALAAPQMRRSPWGRGYKRHTWRMDAGVCVCTTST